LLVLVLVLEVDCEWVWQEQNVLDVKIVAVDR
jgi:hypothetical protein